LKTVSYMANLGSTTTTFKACAFIASLGLFNYWIKKNRKTLGSKHLGNFF
jgi:hypothetical protein